MGLLSSRRGLTGSRLVVLLGALSMFGPLTMDMYLPALPALTRDLSASTSAGQLTLTACMAGLAAGQLLFGPVSDAIGRRRPLVACLVVFVLASLGAVFASSIWVLLVLRLLQGLGGSAGIVIARAVVRDRFPAAEGAQRYALLTLIVVLGRVNRRLVGRLGATAMLQRGIYLGASGGVALLVSVLVGAGLAAVLVSLLAVVASIGLVLSNATALAMRVEPSIAGRASALIGAAQFGVGGLVAPLVGVAGRHSALPMAIVVVTMGGGAIVALRSATARV